MPLEPFFVCMFFCFDLFNIFLKTLCYLFEPLLSPRILRRCRWDSPAYQIYQFITQIFPDLIRVKPQSGKLLVYLALVGIIIRFIRFN